MTDDARVYKALSHRSRLDILDLLLTGPKSTTEIAEAISLTPSAVKHHLTVLLQSQMVTRDEAKGARGRPTEVYSLGASPPATGFPRRDYFELAAAFMAELEKEKGEEGTKGALWSMGYSSLDRAFPRAEKKKVEISSVEDFRKRFLGEFLERVPLKLEVSSSSRGSLSYRVYECPVRELARMYPAQLCGSFEEGLRDRLLEICAGRLTMVQNKSMGNGDHYCEFEAHET